MSHTVLIIDDEKEIRDLISIYLRNEGYQVLTAADGLAGLEQLELHPQIELILLDIMMPKLDGLQACLKIREARNTPILMLSAKSEDTDKILGLGAGADDYVTKPFNPLELLARVKSQLRRYTKLNRNAPLNADEIEIDGLVVNVATHEVKVEGRDVKLTPREFAILELLARHAGQVFSNERIYEAVWQDPFCRSENTVMVHIRKIREKIEAEPRNPRYIKTVWGVGYKLEK
ncbi:MAG TPA: response regulator transcription factor [Bacilli bacterium]|nr:response regulator transcription factor [Bacilli bacterium]